MFIYVFELWMVVNSSSKLLMEWRAKLIHIQGRMDKNRSEMAKLLSHSSGRASTDDRIARQKAIYSLDQKLHVLENQYYALKSNIDNVNG